MSGGLGLLNQNDKTNPTADGMLLPAINMSSAKEIGIAVIESSAPAAPAEAKEKQNKPERTSRFGPSIIDTANAQQQPAANLNLKFPKFLPRSTNNSIGDGLLP